MELWLILIGCIMILLLMVIAGCYLVIKEQAAPYLFDTAGAAPRYETALVLGTAKFTQKGGLNLFFQYRMDAAERIFRANKASNFIVSGASGNQAREQEGEEMKITLIERGLSPDIIIADNYGYRTWDSLWRCRNLYKYNKVMVISQKFHTERAVFIGKNQGMDVIGYNAESVKGSVALRMFVRECLARVKCILDCYILYPRPVYMRMKEEDAAP